jgi:filamentous hemagglutinin
LAPSVENHGGLAGGVIAVAAGDQFFYAVKTQTSVDAHNNFVLESHSIVGEVDSPLADQTVFTNGIQNSLEEAISNGAMQTGSDEFVMAYNPEHGLLGDLLESFWDKNIGGVVATGNARQLGSFYQAGINNNTAFNIAAHSQGTMLNYRAIEDMDFTNGGTRGAGTIQFSGSPLNATQFQGLVENTGFAFINPQTEQLVYSNAVFQVNRPAGETSFFGFALVDSVADMSGILGGNYRQGEGSSLGAAIFSLPYLLTDKSPHSNYLCQTEACIKNPSSVAVEDFRRNIRTPTTDGKGYINPTIIHMPLNQPSAANNQGAKP